MDIKDIIIKTAQYLLSLKKVRPIQKVCKIRVCVDTYEKFLPAETLRGNPLLTKNL